MGSIVTFEGIDEAFENLRYNNKRALKFKLINTIREQYKIRGEVATVREIDTDFLVKSLWDTGDDPSIIRNRRKNFNSIKSTVNADLKRLYEEGKNSEGIIINQKNIFDMSDEAKSEMLESFSYGESGDSQMPLSKIADVLNVINDFISNKETSFEDDEKFDQLKEIIKEISGKVGVAIDASDDIPHGKIEKSIGEGGTEILSEGNTYSNELPNGPVNDGENGKAIKDKFDEVELEEKTKEDMEETLEEDESTEKVEEDLFDDLDENIEEEFDEVPEADVEEDFANDLEDDDYEEVETEDASDDEFEDVLEENEGGSAQELEDEAIDEIDDSPEENSGEISETSLEELDEEDMDEFEEVLEGGIGELEDDVDGEKEETAEEELEAFPEEEIDEELADDLEGDEYEEVEDTGNDGLETIPEEEGIGAVEDADIDEIDEVPEEELEEVPEDEIEEALVDDLEDDEYEEIEAGDVTDDEFEGVPDEVTEDNSEELAEDVVDEIEEAPEDEIEEELVDELEDDDYEEVEVTGDDGLEVLPEEEGIEAVDDTEIDEIDEIPEDEIEEAPEAELEEVPEDEIEEELADELEDDDYEEVEDIGDDGLQGIPEGGGIGALEDADIDEIDDIPEEELEEVTEDEIDEELADDLEDDEYEEIEGGDAQDDEYGSIDEVEDDTDIHDYTLEEILDDYDASGYISEEGQQKALLFADEFDRMLSETDRYYNQYILIPGGKYLTGHSTPNSNEKKQKSIQLSDFYFGKFPVTNNLFELFIEKTGYVTTAERTGYGIVYKGRYRNIIDEKSNRKTVEWSSSLESGQVEGACWFKPNGPGSSIHGKRNHPVVQVSLEDALAFAAWTGKRLPSEEEWEAASRTSKGLDYPWGKSLMDGLCNIEASAIGDTTPVDEFEEAANKFGVYDLLGNVLEWTSSNDTLSKKTVFVAKGGSWVSGDNIRLTQRVLLETKTCSNILGFRCIAYNSGWQRRKI